MLTFDESTHTYRWNGVIVPSVTGIIKEFIKVTINGSDWYVNRFTGAVIPSYLMEEGAEKGKDLHKGCQLILQGGIDWNTLSDEYIDPLIQFEKFLSDFSIQPLYTEFMFYHPRYGYAGTIDIIAIIEKALTFIDIKTGECSTVGWQTSAYEKSFCAQEKYTGRTARFALWLPKNGLKYKFEKLTNENDFEMFKACLMLNGACK
jgi:hypothetical protein